MAKFRPELYGNEITRRMNAGAALYAESSTSA